MIIVGIDPSLTATGIGVIRDGIPLHHREGWPGISAASHVDRVSRVVALFQKIRATIAPYRPDLVLIESPAYTQTLGSACDRNILWGLLVHEYGASVNATKYAGVTPTCRAQFATGNGHASKLQVVDAVNGWWPHLNLRTVPASRMQDGEADALIMATMGTARYEPHLLPFQLANHQRNNLDAVAWPVGMENAP